MFDAFGPVTRTFSVFGWSMFSACDPASTRRYNSSEFLCAGSLCEQIYQEVGTTMTTCGVFVGLLCMVAVSYVAAVIAIRYLSRSAYRLFLHVFPPPPRTTRKERRKQILKQRRQESRARRISGQRRWTWRSYVSFSEARYRKEPWFAESANVLTGAGE